jgi:peroxiredoxin
MTISRSLVVFALLGTGLTIALDHPDGQELVGKHAPDLRLSHWINSAPLEMADLKGKVVLVRWWTDTCELCAATAPALRKLQQEYGSRGLQVIGVFHPKPAGDWDLERMRRAADRYQFTFPVGFDGDWGALRRWWLTGARDYTSVSFLIDKQGVIRSVHPGGEYHEGGGPGHESCDRDFRKLHALIARLLAE